MKDDVPALAALVERADRSAVARALNWVEDQRPDARDRLRALCTALDRSAAKAHRVGFTGPPGVGKSTLAAAVARELRKRGLSVGVVAVDPSSLRSGGAILGDRARMSFDAADEGVFVRSLATSGDLGGLARAVPAAVTVLSAAFDWVIVETTGVGQSEDDVRHVVDVVALVVQPGSGDSLQFIKAGIMEVPDLFVVNKIDLEGIGTRALSALKAAVATTESALGEESRPMFGVSAKDETGVDALVAELIRMRDTTKEETLIARRKEGALQVALSLFRRRYGEYGEERLGGSESLRAVLLAHIGEGAMAAVDAASSALRLQLEP